jgi:hypothetical protein
LLKEATEHFNGKSTIPAVTSQIEESKSKERVEENGTSEEAQLLFVLRVFGSP